MVVDPKTSLTKFKLLNGSNARIYRLALLDESGSPVHEQIKQIGTDGGLLGQPVDIPRDGLLLAPAERADLIVDFRTVRGQRLTLVNTAGAPFDNSPATQPPGTPDPDNRLPHPEVMEFRVSFISTHGYMTSSSKCIVGGRAWNSTGNSIDLLEMPR
jgi:FtsP/CotA-like multicopper oxidase with cupredoxin domain